MPLQPRKHLRNVAEGIHGGFDYKELAALGIDPADIIDFSVSTNPAGIPPGVLKQVPVKELAKYPDSVSTELVSALARKTRVSEGNIITGNGSTELIRLAVLAYAGEGDTVLIIEPAYGEYRTASEIAGADIRSCTSSEKDGFRPDVPAVIQCIKSQQPKLVFLCNPNNPAGYYLEKQELEQILDAAADSLVVMDEAYAAFVDDRWESTGLIDKGNLLIIRSMTKDYSLAGLRLGYALAAEDIISVLRKIAPPWNLNACAQRAGVAALQKDEYLVKSRELVQKSKRYLMRELEKLGYACLPSAANFFLMKAGNTAALRGKLLRKGILVRDCTSFGLPGYIRLAPQTMTKNRALIAALKELGNG